MDPLAGRVFEVPDLDQLTRNLVKLFLIIFQIKRLGLDSVLDIQRTIQMVRSQRSGETLKKKIFSELGNKRLNSKSSNLLSTKLKWTDKFGHRYAVRT